jgi:3-phosphoshikimate 1-carboxyvinyltransferase
MPSLLIHPQLSPLAGAAAVPGDKSISHRIVMLSPLAEGTSKVDGWLPAGDTLATLEVMRALGAHIVAKPVTSNSWTLTIHGQGLAGLRPPPGPLDCRNAGTCMRLMAGLLAGQSFPSVLDGSEQLRRRPMGRVAEPLRQMGATIEDTGGRAPLRLRPSVLHSITYELSVASAQVKSAILLAGLYAQGDTTVIEPAPTRDHTERLLRALGVALSSAPDGSITLHHSPVTPRSSPFTLHPSDFALPSDFSSAAFLLAAAAILPDSIVTVPGCGTNPTRTGLLDILREMGANPHLENPREVAW